MLERNKKVGIKTQVLRERQLLENKITKQLIISGDNNGNDPRYFRNLLKLECDRNTKRLLLFELGSEIISQPGIFSRWTIRKIYGDETVYLPRVDNFTRPIKTLAIYDMKDKSYSDGFIQDLFEIVSRLKCLELKLKNKETINKFLRYLHMLNDDSVKQLVLDCPLTRENLSTIVSANLPIKKLTIKQVNQIDAEYLSDLLNCYWLYQLHLEVQMVDGSTTSVDIPHDDLEEMKLKLRRIFSIEPLKTPDRLVFRQVAEKSLVNVDYRRGNYYKICEGNRFCFRICGGTAASFNLMENSSRALTYNTCTRLWPIPWDVVMEIMARRNQAPELAGTISFKNLNPWKVYKRRVRLESFKFRLRNQSFLLSKYHEKTELLWYYNDDESEDY